MSPGERVYRDMKRTALLIALLLALGAVVCGALAEDYVIPAGTLVIEAEAFAGTGFRERDYDDDEDEGGMESIWYSVRLPEGIRRIESRAFADSGLYRINLPDSLEYIAPDAFDGCRDVYATVSIGSYAQSYCDAHDNIDYDAKASADTTVIGVEQYAGAAFTSLVLPEGVRRIESRAFADSALMVINFPDSLEYIAPDAFDGVDEAFCPEVYPGSVGEDYCIENDMPYLTKEEPDVYIVEREFTPVTTLEMMRGLTRDGYEGGRGLVLYQWGIGHNDADYDSVSDYMIDAIEVSAEASAYITAGRSRKLSADAYIRISCSDDVPIGDDVYDKLVLPDALTVSYTYRGKSLSRKVDIVIFAQSTMTMFRDYDYGTVAEVGVPMTYIAEAWTADDDGEPLERIAAFTPHWTVEDEPVDEDGDVYVDGEKIAHVEFSADKCTATITWLVESEEGYSLSCADDNAISGNVAYIYVDFGGDDEYGDDEYSDDDED